MTIPSESEFKDYLEILSNFHAREFAYQIYAEKPTDLALLETLIRSGKREIGTKLKSSSLHKVEIWLERQATFKMAEKRAFRLKRNDTESSYEEADDDQWMIELANNAKYFIVEHNDLPVHTLIDEDTKLYKFLHKIFDMPSVVKWRIALVRGLVEYYFTENATEVSKCHKQVPSELGEMKRLLDQFHDVIQARFSKYNDIVDFSVLERSVERTIKILEDYFPEKIEDFYPIKRDDKTAKERLFVYWMIRAHRGLFRSPRPDAISLLLDLEGIQSPLDVRQVEKLCAAFKQQGRRGRRRLSQYNW